MSTRLHSPRNPKLDFTITVPSTYQFAPNPSQTKYKFHTLSQDSPLAQKVRNVPTTSLDKLHPLDSETHPHTEYVDEGLWKNKISFRKDTSVSVAQAEIAARTSRTYENLDALCEAELGRRFPGYQLIKGVKATFKDNFRTLARIGMGKEKYHRELTQKEINKYKKQIAYSAINRDDLFCIPSIEDPELRSFLKLKNDSVLQTEHLFAKNSPLNGQSFLLDGQAVHLSQAIACSSDRKVENTGNLRVVQTKSKESLGYTGRADSDHKALEQASFIFFNELRTKGKGITQVNDENNQPIYELNYVVNSMLSAPWIWSAESPIAPFPEREYLENELKAFASLRKKGTVTIEDPNFPGQTYQVRFNPIAFSRSTNLFSRLETWLPPFFTGQSRDQEVSEEGLSSLQPLIETKLSQLRQKLSISLPQDQKLQIRDKIKAIENTLQALEKHTKDAHLLPEEELLLRDYLCKLLELPSVYHCKSSTDRTSIPLALSASLQQWIELGLPLTQDLRELLQDFRFKELFVINWMAGHQITRYARGGKGTVAGEELNNKNLGLALSRGIAQNPCVARLVPERYLKDFPLSKKIKTSALYALLFVPLCILFYIPLITLTAFRNLGGILTLGKKRHWIGPLQFTLPLLPFTLFFNFFRIFPDKVLNEDSPQVGGRHLIAGGKKSGKEDNEN